MTPEKDVAGLLPSSEGAVTILCDLKDWLDGLVEANFNGHVPQSVFSEANEYSERIEALAAPAAAIAAREQEARHLREVEPSPPPGERVPQCEKCGGCREWGGNGLWHHAGCPTKQGAAWLQTAPREEAPVASGERECGNGECGWKGVTDRMLGSVGPLCPKCGETTELTSTSGAGLGGAVASSEAVEALRAFAAVTPLPFGSVGTRDVDIASWHAAHKAASTALASQPGCAVEGEAVAKAIYEQWADRPGYVAWVDGGNSLKQDDARAIARAALKVNSTEMSGGAK